MSGNHKGFIYNALASSSIASALNIDPSYIVKGLEEFTAVEGRFEKKSIKNGNGIIINDCYNASPESMKAAIVAFGQMKTNGLKVAVLGDMLELGKESEELHQNIGKIVYKAGIDKLIVVGERARDIARGAMEAGMAIDNIFRFPFSSEAGLFLQDRIRKGDLLLIKGSQGMRMEKIVKELMSEPFLAEELLVRHDKKWKKK